MGIKGADKAERLEDYKKYIKAVLANRPHSLRNLLELVPLPSGPVPIDEVEPIEEIRRRFTTAGMSLGALRPRGTRDACHCHESDRWQIEQRRGG